MFGILSFAICSVYLLCILSTVACLIYGVINWNKGGTDEIQDLKKSKEWQKEEEEIKENL